MMHVGISGVRLTSVIKILDNKQACLPTWKVPIMTEENRATKAHHVLFQRLKMLPMCSLKAYIGHQQFIPKSLDVQRVRKSLKT